MFSRFLSDQDKELVDKIVDSNEFKDEIVAEIEAENFYTVNLHPKLTKHIIQWHESPGQSDLLLKDLLVKRLGEQPVLWSRKEQKKVLPVNYGFEALERRSPLFQTLTAFGSQNINIDPLRQLLRKHYMDHNASNSWPRIVLDNGLVILRKGWLFSPEELPQAKTLDLSNWLLLRKWQREHGLPEQIYLKLIKEDSSQGTDDHRKPQYFDFQNPFFILLWKSLLRQFFDKVFIEEVYPTQGSNNKPFNNRIQEWVIEYLPTGE